MKILESNFGKLTNGDVAKLFSLQNANGMIVNITNYGGIIKDICTPDKYGNFKSVCLGFQSIDDYQNNPAYFGALIGRYANRISDGSFKIKETHFQLSKNDGKHHLHGGYSGFDKRLWKAKHSCTPSTARLELRYLSNDGEEGYPGNCKVKAIYELNNENELRLILEAECDQSTPINLTQHSYFNLGGGGDVLSHAVKINSEFYCPITEEHIPTGEICHVMGTPFDLRTPRSIENLINQDHNQIKIGKGFNHYFFIGDDKNAYQASLNLAATIVHPDSGRTLEIHTKKPGIQFYSSGFLDGHINSEPIKHTPYSGLCFEPQHCPNSLNNPSLPSTILHPGNQYTSEICYRFSTMD